MKKLSTYALLSLIGVVSLNLLCTKKNEGRIVILYETDYFHDSIKTVIAKVVKDYDEVYKLPYDTLTIRDTVSTTYLKEDHEYLDQASAFGTTIIYNKLAAENSLTKKYIRDLTAHELFHTLKPKNVKHFPKPIETGWKAPYSRLVSCDGLGLIYEPRASAGFPLIEEASAEMLAHSLYAEYSPSTAYFSIGELLGVILDSTELELDDIVIAVKSNDFGLVVSKVYNIPIKQITNDDYMFLITAFIHHKRHPEKDPSGFPKELKTFLATY